MKSVIALTEEIGIREAADDLIAQMRRKIELQQHSCGLLYYDFEMDGDALCRMLQQEFGFDILGCSTIATLDNQNGYRDMSVMFTVLTADDCDFHFGITEALTNANAKQKINETFVKTRLHAGAEPKLGFVLFPCGTDIVFDKHIQDLSEMSDHLPIIGGIPSSTGDEKKSVVFNGSYYLDRCAILLITGALHPVISLANVISPISSRWDVITRAEGNAIFEVNGEPFIKYIESFGIDTRLSIAESGQIFFQKYPLLIENENSPFTDELPYVRVLDHIDWDTGAGYAYAGIPEGARVSIASLKREDITLTVQRGLEELFAKMNASGEEFTTIICITCAARHITLTPNFEDEGNAIKAMVSETYNFSGFYSYGELCPIAIEGGRANNQLHNGSIVFCAF